MHKSIKGSTMTKALLKQLDTLAKIYMLNNNKISKSNFTDSTMSYEDYENECNQMVTSLQLSYSSTMDKWKQLNALFEGYNLKINRQLETKSVTDILDSIK